MLNQTKIVVGSLLCALLSLATMPSIASAEAALPWVIASTMGQSDDDYGFFNVTNAQIDDAGEIFDVSNNAGMLQKRDPDGLLLAQSAEPNLSVYAVSFDGTVYAAVGNNIQVLDGYLKVISTFSPSWSTQVCGGRDVSSVFAMDVDSLGNLWLQTDCSTAEYSPSGTLLNKFYSDGGTGGWAYRPVLQVIGGYVYGISTTGPVRYTTAGVFDTSYMSGGLSMVAYSVLPSGINVIETQSTPTQVSLEVVGSHDFVNYFPGGTNGGSIGIGVDTSANGITVATNGSHFVILDGLGKKLKIIRSAFSFNLDQLRNITAVSQDSQGAIYALTRFPSRVTKFNTEGVAVASFGALFPGDTSLPTSKNFAVNANGDVFIATNSAIYKYDSTGARSTFTSPVGYIASIAMGSDGFLYASMAGGLVIKLTDQGQILTSLSVQNAAGGTSALSVDAEGGIYVSDPSTQTESVYSNTGVLRNSWTTAEPSFGSCLDSSGNLYLLGFNGINKYSASGDSLGSIAPTDRSAAFSPAFRNCSVTPNGDIVLGNKATNQVAILRQANLFAQYSKPIITGTSAAGSTLTVNPGSWDPRALLSYQWMRDNAPISGEVGANYLLKAQDIGAQIKCTVTGTATGFLTQKTESSSTLINPGTLSLTPVPTVNGSATVGSSLSVETGAWDADVILTRQWLRNGIPISGATLADYSLVGSDLGANISVSISGGKEGFTSVTRESESVSVTAGAFSQSPLPTISGVGEVGQQLTGHTGVWAPNPSLAYMWLRDQIEIFGETGVTYTVTSPDAGHIISFVVTGSKTGYSSTTKISLGVAIAGTQTLSPTTAPLLSGNSQVGQNLSVIPGNWPAATILAYQWYRDGSPIPGATSATYAVASNDLGHSLAVRYSAILSGYSPVSGVLSARPVIQGLQTRKAAPLLAGVFKVGGKVTCTVKGWSNGETFKYQWLLDGKSIPKATANSLVITKAMKGHKLSLSISGSLLGYNTATIVSISKVVG